jgi:hypothetical protein
LKASKFRIACSKKVEKTAIVTHVPVTRSSFSVELSPLCGKLLDDDDDDGPRERGQERERARERARATES